MKYEKTCSQGSFTVWGTGFRYNYEAHNNIIDVAPLDENKAVAHLKCDHHIARNPLAYVKALNKTNQIKALMFSNNETIDLSQTMELERIGSLIKATANITRFAFDLDTHNFARFSSLFTKDFNLKRLKVKQFKSQEKGHDLFLGRIQTIHGNSVCARACTLVGLTARLSDRTLKDLMTMEFGHNFNNSAHTLLDASSKLGTISRILDENFIPQHKLERYKSLTNRLNPDLILRKKRL